MYDNKSLKKNFFYNFSLNILNILFPLITSPYVSRVLGANNLGKYNFALSFSNWFLIFATFGTTTYGIREIAKCRNNIKKLNSTFSEIFIINFIATIISLGIYIVVIFISPRINNEIPLFLISAIIIFLNLFCIDWFYMGIEEYGFIAFRSLIIKTICLICIFIFIRKRSDYIVYALITVLALGLTNIFNFIHCRKFVKLTCKNINLLKHLNKLLIFFLSSLVISVYTTFDQVFLGFSSSNKSVAFYNRARQIYSIALSITLSISTVLIPKLTYLYKSDFESYKRLLKKSIDYIYIFSIPFVFGLVLLSKELMWFFGGKEFEGANLSLIIISSLVFTVSLGTWQYNQLFLPLGHEKVGLRVQLFMAIVSGVFNIVLVPRYGYIGTSISIVLAETFGMIFGIYYAKAKIKVVKVRYITQGFYKYIFSSICMAIIIIIIKSIHFSYMINILMCVPIGGMTYFIILYLLKDIVARGIFSYFLDKMKSIINKRRELVK